MQLNCKRLASGLLVLASGWLIVAPLARSQDVLTWHNDIARTGQYLDETILTPANVSSASFGKLFVVPVDGKVDAQPLYASTVSVPQKGIRNILVVATEHGSVYAVDAGTGSPIWTVSTLLPGETTSDARSCDQIVPEIGVTGTPVIDRTRGPHGAIYLIAMSKNANGAYFHRLHALDLATGAELFGGPKEIQATSPGSGDNSSGGTVIFEPAQHKARPGLLLLNGVVYTTWGSHCDVRPYNGWVIGYDASTLAQTAVLNIMPNGSAGAIWMSGAGPAADAAGNIYVLAGNGDFDTNLTNGFPSNGNYGNAFLKISTTGGLAVADYFEMQDQRLENQKDIDLGSGGAMVLPDMTDASNIVRSLVVGAGKDTNIYLLRRDKMGGYNSNSNQIYQELTGGLPGGIWGGPAYYKNMLYYGAVGQPIRAFQFSKATLPATPLVQTANEFGYPGTTPSVSANQDTNGIVWAAENSSQAVLHAYDAMTLQELYNSNQASGGRDQFGTGNKFITPTIANGRVYVGTTSGVGVFGLLGAPSAVSISPDAGAGTPYTFSALFSDPNGAASLSRASVMFESDFRQRSPSAHTGTTSKCEVYYDAASGLVNLYNDTRTATATLSPGSGSISNSQCTVSGAGSSITLAGNNLTLTLALSFTGPFSRSKSIFLNALDKNGANSGWVQKGTWDGVIMGPRRQLR